MTDLVSIATYDKIVSFSEHATNKFQTGKISYEQFCNIEMMDLGYNPNNPKEVEEYLNFIEDLKDELIDIIFVTCLQCNAEHPVTQYLEEGYSQKDAKKFASEETEDFMSHGRDFINNIFNYQDYEEEP